MKYAYPYEYLSGDAYGWFPRLENEALEDWKKRAASEESNPVRPVRPVKENNPKLAQPLEFFNGDIHHCCPRLENETCEKWSERAKIVSREYGSKRDHDFGVPNEKREEVKVSDLRTPVASPCNDIDCDPLGSTEDSSEYNEGDIDSKERGTCARSNAGKVALSLVPFHLLAGATRVLMAGSKKYAPWNWAKGGKWSTPMDCLLRHLFKWWFCGEEIDPESGEHHLDHVMCNLLFLIHYKELVPNLDDRPEPSMTGFDQSLHLLEPRNEDQ